MVIGGHAVVGDDVVTGNGNLARKRVLPTAEGIGRCLGKHTHDTNMPSCLGQTSRRPPIVAHLLTSRRNFFGFGMINRQF
ncbi:unnamed protein product [Lactuca virosa]|uniref:Uncharacterized protein n=1 Tax=Lactuca virosa TaxID=75947 RepID=A0AAU9MQU7_9ASTR|nr:unnamed protein product [Lactuca virosa]